MREFFRGWQRKTGLALLAMALLLTGALFRSLALDDWTLVRIDNDAYFLISSSGAFHWVCEFNGPCQESVRVLRWSVGDDSKSGLDQSGFERCEERESWQATGRFRCLGFEFTSLLSDVPSPETERLQEIWFARVPILGLILPLTLLLAWLILAKPRPAKSAKESDHA